MGSRIRTYKERIKNKLISKIALLIYAFVISIILLTVAILCNFIWNQVFLADVLLSLFGSLITAVIITSISIFLRYREYSDEKKSAIYELEVYCDDLLSSMEVIYYSSFNKKELSKTPVDLTNKQFMIYASNKINEGYYNSKVDTMKVFMSTKEHNKIINTSNHIFYLAKKIVDNKEYARLYNEKERNAANAIINSEIGFSYYQNTVDIVVPLNKLYDLITKFDCLEKYGEAKYSKRDLKLIEVD